MERSRTSAAVPARTHVRAHERAFTLVELLVVMIIIAILMAIAIPTFLSQKSTAHKTQLLENISMIQKAMEACATNNLDATYTGCGEHTHIWEYEPALRNLDMAVGAPQHAGEYDIDGIDENANRIWAPGRTEVLYGYEIYAYVQDGDKRIWFQLVHWPDGTVTKKCGEGGRPTWSKDDEGPVDGSRICTTGTW